MHLCIKVCAGAYKLCHLGGIIFLGRHQEQQVYRCQALCKTWETPFNDWLSSHAQVSVH